MTASRPQVACPVCGAPTGVPEPPPPVLAYVPAAVLPTAVVMLAATAASAPVALVPVTGACAAVLAVAGLIGLHADRVGRWTYPVEHRRALVLWWLDHACQPVVGVAPDGKAVYASE